MHEKNWAHPLTALSFGAALLAFITLMPFYSAVGASAHNAARLAQIPLFLLATVFLLVGERARWTRANTIKVGALALLMLASALHAHQPAAALRELELVFSLFFLTLAIRALREEIGLEKVLLAIVTAWFIYEIFFLLAWSASALNGGVGNFWLMVPGFDNPRFLNHAQTPALPLLIGIASDKSNSARLRRFGWVTAALSIAILIGLAARASGLALVLSGLAVALLFRKQGRLYLKSGLIALLSAGVFYFCVFYALPLQLEAAVMTAQHSANDMVSDHSRLFLWKIAFDQWMSSPLLGVGPMHFAEYVNLRGAHPHNVYVQALAEYGLPAVLLVLGWLLHSLWRGIRQRQAAEDRLSVFDVSIVAAVFSLAIDAGFSGNFVMPVSQVWICIAIALFAAGSAGASEAVPAATQLKPVAGRLILFVFLVCQVLLSYPTVKEYEMPRPTLGQRPGSPESEPNNPRFWLDGWL
jgi:O-antigen ligase